MTWPLRPGCSGEARPTAVNLAWGTRRALAAYQAALGAAPDPHQPGHDPQRSARDAALAEARAIAADDAGASAAMARHGLSLIPEGARVLTHCNTGALVSAGGGTAFAVILAAHQAGRLTRLWVDETRPLLQGARLTAYEAQRAGIDYAVLPDSAAAGLMASGAVDVVLTGADRIAADGSVANKVGTYSLAVLAKYHRVPLVVVAPVSTIDFGTATGGAIVVEHRGAQEVTTLGGQVIAPEGSAAYNPAFDVTPPALVSALVTERGITRPVTAGNLRLLRTPPARRKSALHRCFHGTMRLMKGRVLVVDDDAALSEMLGIMLRGEGFEPTFVSDGDKAMEVFRDTHPDLVLLDLMLPGIDGIDVCRQIRTESGVPIVMLTAKSDTVDVVLGLESGADDYIVKPFKSKELIARVRARLRRTDDPAPEMLQIVDVEIDVAGPFGQAQRAAGQPHPAGVRPAGGAGPQAAPGVHPRGPAGAGLGIPARGGHPSG